MTKVFKYSKSSWLAVVIMIALLFTQAQCELALPDYMSDIVSTGIQTNGIHTSIPEVISKDTLDKVLILSDDKEKEVILENYELVLAIDIKDYDFNLDIDYSNDIYVYNDKGNDEFDSLMARKLLAIMGIEQAASSGQLPPELSNLPEGIDLFDVLAMAPYSTIEPMIANIDKQFEAMGESTLVIAGASAVKMEYELLGVDISNIQNNYIFSVGVLMLAIALLAGLIAIAVGYISSFLAAKVARNLRKDVFNKVHSFSNQEINQFSTASLITRTTNDVQQVQMALTMIFRIVIYAPIMGVGAILRVINTNVSMMWIIGITILIIMGIIALVFIFVGPKFKMMQTLVDKINLVMRESLTGMLVIRAFHNEEIEESKFEKANEDIKKVGLFTGTAMTSLMPIIMFIMNAVMIAIIWIGSHQVDLGNMQIGEMMAFMQYAMQIIIAFMMIAMVSIMLPRAGVAAKRIFEVLETDLSITDPKEAKQLDSNDKATLTFNNVSFKYPNAEEDVLSNINFIAKPGETTAFIGSTGSGKSTLINLVPRFFDVTGGEILLNNINIKDLSLESLRDKIGLVPQKGVLFSGSIATNIKYSDENMSDEQMQEAATIAQAMEFINNKEEKFDTEISQGGSNVSGGQKQRLSIARALAKQPDILIFDDSFSALDFKTDALLREALNEQMEKAKTTVLIVGQRIASIMNADQIIVLDEGKMVSKGTHKELMKTCNVYQEIALSQLSKEELENE